ncbi:hypothetical protein [Kitasatospora sp. NPDC050543]|uniref:hypothetical protein n=1 Tax=Kitasatospora sp. NPDC050543 TaxID=3364054 RepID=UPI003791D21E
MRDNLELLLSADRPELPEPSLLGWLASHCSPADLPAAVRLAASAGGMAPHTEWPVISDAAQERSAARGARQYLSVLPQAPNSQADGLGRLGLPHDTALHELTDQEVVYLMPFLPGPVIADMRWRSVAAVEEAVRAEVGWYATALAARAAPFLEEQSRMRIVELAGQLDERWRRRLTELARVWAPWPSAAVELEASHPSFPEADHIAARLSTAMVEEVCHRVISRLAESLEVRPRAYPPGPVPWFPFEELDPASPSTLEDNLSGPPDLLGDEAPGQLSRHVSTGVAETAQPEVPLSADRCLEPGTDYLFWFEIGGEQAAGSIETDSDPVVMPIGDLTVVLFSFEGHIEISEGRDIGRLALYQDGQVEIHSAPAGAPVLGARLFFPIRTPQRSGRYRLRCHLYHRQTLLQSRLVEMQVKDGAPIQAYALAAQVDYTSGTALDPLTLAELRPLTVSVFVNDNGDGTHAFRFWGGDDIKAQAILGEGELQNHIDNARGALRKASWGSSDAGSSGPPFRYDNGLPVDYTEDLIDLACNGYRLWASIGGGFAEAGLPPAGTASPIKQLQARLRRPGVIEIANKVSSRMVVPAALFYDHPLDCGLKALSVCRVALDALRTGVDPASSPCFQGNCPRYGVRSVVCPSGFWGYRHAIGLPQSTASTLQETSLVPAHGAPYIPYTDQPRSVIGIADEFAGDHTTMMRARYQGRIHTDREELLAELRGSTAPQLVYFYCHGDLVRGIPVLLIGGPLTAAISYEQIADDMFWPDTRPLVFLNGCRTAAVEPRHAMTFVDAFVRRARASGLIGTEIITYESLAAEFAESVLHHFIDRQASIAHAMRTARLALLSRGNPLGLIYVAYAPPHLRMKKV